MNHRITNVTDLFDDSKRLYEELIISSNDSSADGILSHLKEAVEALKTSWEGKDAGKQINNVITVYNSIVEIRNKLSRLASNCTEIAARYREIQNSNGGSLPALKRIDVAEINPMGEYSDLRDTINISDGANKGKELIDTANSGFDSFLDESRKIFNKIMDNWVVGPGKQEAEDSFEQFLSVSNRYKEILTNASLEITNAIKSYNL